MTIRTASPPTIDPSRMERLRRASVAEKAALEDAVAGMNEKGEKAARLRREILALDRSQMRAGSRAERDAKQAERDALDRQIGEDAQSIELQQERVHAANRLRQRCEDWLRRFGAERAA